MREPGPTPSDRAARLDANRRRRGNRAIAFVALIAAIGALVWTRMDQLQANTHGSSTHELAAGNDEPTGGHAKAKSKPKASQNWVVAENAKTGTDAWRIPPGPSYIQGYGDHVSAQVGDDVALYVSAGASTFHVEAYRMGWYQGHGARLVWKSSNVPATVQPKPQLVSATRMIRAAWQPTYHVRVGNDWPPGDYLLKLVSDHGSTYVPLTVRDDKSHADVFIMNAVTTWQAYNDWGGYSLYHGPNGAGTTRSNIVTFDRPYSRDGAGDFIANELGLVSLAEHLGFDVSYTTDVDIHEHPELILNHHVLVSLGHDEYWSLAMRNGVEAARDKGVNIMFLGANALYRRIRLQPGDTGPDREEVNYRGVANDTGYATHPDEPTTSWRESPKARPENSLTGTFYECNPVNVDGVVADAGSWALDGTRLHNGDHVQLLIGTEYDRVQPDVVGTPSNIEVLLHSPLRCGGHASYSDAAYYTTASGAGVFDAGTNAWVCKLFSGCPADRPFLPNPTIQRITENLLRVFAAGPAGRAHPSQNNLKTLPKDSSASSYDASGSGSSGSSSTHRHHSYTSSNNEGEGSGNGNGNGSSTQDSTPHTTPYTTPHTTPHSPPLTAPPSPPVT
jgi:hypothetical protein